MKSLSVWWQNLPGRERRLMLAGAVLIGFTALFLFIGKPLYHHYQQLQQDLTDARTAQMQMQQQRNTILSLQGNGDNTPAITGGSLHTAVISELKQLQLDGTGTSTEEKDKDTVTLKLEDKPFDTLILFLGNLETRYAAHATRMTLQPAKQTGAVNADLDLER